MNCDERETLDKNPNSPVAQRDEAIKLLLEVSKNPDAYIKHHDLASSWLKRARRLIELSPTPTPEGVND